MTEKRYTHNILGSVFKDGKLFALTQGECQAITLCIELNELHEENMMLKEYNNKLMEQPLLFDVQTIPNTMKIIEANTQLEEENEQLKTIRSDLICELDIVQNELNIAIDKGFTPSKPYKNYMASKKTEYDKFWEKIKTHNNTLKELKE